MADPPGLERRGASEGTQRAMLNILDDFADEKRHLENSQQAMLNILDDLDTEKIKVEVERAKVELINRHLQDEVGVRKRAEKASSRLAAIVASSNDAIISESLDGTILSWNRSAERLYGYTEAEAVGKSIMLIVPPELRGETRKMLARIAQAELIERHDTVRVRKDGSCVDVSVTLSPIKTPRGEVIGASAIARDITTQKRAQVELQRHREQLRALTKRLERASEEERARVARDLHDDIGQLLTAVKMDLIWIGKRVPEEEREARQRLSASVQLIDAGVRSVRTICSGLRPSILDDLGLAAAIEWQANEFSSRTGIACRVALPAPKFALPSDHATALFRIFQECLTNVSRHARAGSVDVSLSREGEDLVLIVQDDGHGFDGAAPSSSLGILGMKERAQTCGGEFEIISSIGKGTTVAVRVPFYTDTASQDAKADAHRG